MRLPEFKVSVDEGETIVTLNGRFVGRAWRADASWWWVCRYREVPKQFSDEESAKKHLLGILKMPLPEWAVKPTGSDPCCGDHGPMCDLYEDNGCCDRCPRWAKS